MRLLTGLYGSNTDIGSFYSHSTFSIVLHVELHLHVRSRHMIHTENQGCDNHVYIHATMLHMVATEHIESKVVMVMLA